MIADILCTDALPPIILLDCRSGGNPYGKLKRIYVDPRASPVANSATAHAMRRSRRPRFEFV